MWPPHADRPCAETDEEDVFESDFESTDEEAAQEETEPGDKAVKEEERRARKVGNNSVEAYV